MRFCRRRKANSFACKFLKARFQTRHSKFKTQNCADGSALQNRHAALLLQRARGNPAARTRAGTEPWLLESGRRQAENESWRIALRLRLPRGARRNRAGTAPVGFASGRTHQRTRLSRPDALADVFVRGEGEIKILAAGSCGRAL